MFGFRALKLIKNHSEFYQSLIVFNSCAKLIRFLRGTIAIKKMKLEKASGLSKVSMEMISASEKVGIDVMMKLCQQRVLGEKEMPEDWKTSVKLSIYKGKGDVTNCGAYRGVKLLEHGLKIVEKVLEKRIRALVEVNDTQFGFMSGKDDRCSF